MRSDMNSIEVSSHHLGPRRRRGNSDIPQTQVSDERPHIEESSDRTSLLYTNYKDQLHNTASHKSKALPEELSTTIIKGGMANHYTDELMLQHASSSNTSDQLNGRDDGKRPVARIKLWSRDAHVYILNDKLSGFIQLKFIEIPESVKHPRSYVDKYTIDRYRRQITDQIYQLVQKYSHRGDAQKPEDIVIFNDCHPDLKTPEDVLRDRRQGW